MTWSAEVALIFLQFLRDPEIIRYLLDIAKPIHLNFISEEARDFHVSLRMTREKRWALTKELCKLRKFNQMNKIVPITCSLPFDDGMWTISCKLLRMIGYFISILNQNRESQFNLRSLSHQIQIFHLQFASLNKRTWPDEDMSQV